MPKYFLFYFYNFIKSYHHKYFIKKPKTDHYALSHFFHLFLLNSFLQI